MPYNELSHERRIKATFPKIEKSIYSKICDLSVTAWITKEPVTFLNRFSGIKTHLNDGDNWGNLFDCAWFNFIGVLPEESDAINTVLIIDLSGEAYIADENGIPVQGITTVASMFDLTLGFPGKKVIYLNGLIKENNSIDIWADAGNNDLFGNQKNNGTLVEAYIAAMNVVMRDLYYDFEVLNELRSRIPKNKSQFQKITSALYKASLELMDYTAEEAIKARNHLKIELDRKNTDYPLSISAIGHSHIDLAWLWPIRETVRKGARTFSTALMNIEKYPEYIFGASQPQLYQWIKEYYPELFNKIKNAVLKGRWELQGAMWVESDTNVTGGESLIRQMLYGKKFYKDEFGFEVRNVWLPDVFGYSASLPQIMKKSDVDYFMTIKISWSEFNKFPHHTFIWKGIDGSEVLAHMPPEGTYNSSAAPRALLDSEEKFADKGVSDECLLLFGIGDGGGGPGEEHLERLKREKNLLGLAPVNQEHSGEFFKRIADHTDDYKTWNGELYLEHHRGTYTSEGRNKRFNKLMENLLRDAEIIGCISKNGYNFEKIEQIWKEVLLYQFHDILPGSSIKRVYDESLARYEILENEVNESANFCKCKIDSENLVYNTLSWERKEWINFNDKWKFTQLQPMSGRYLKNITGKSIDISIDSENEVIENSKLKISFSKNGSIKSVWDKINNREVINQEKEANILTVYKDDGDAWDFPHDYREHVINKLEYLSGEYVLDGPEAKKINIYSIGKSTVTQEIVLCDESGRIDIRTKIDWKEKNTMLRSSFPLNVSSLNLSCGIQFGYIERPSHDNTLWDMSKMEVCGQNYVDISQRDYGVAILSDYKYGYSSTLNSIDICLLRSTASPDTDGDIGFHEFTYSVFPHKGDHVSGGVIEQGIELSRPLRFIENISDNYQENISFLKIDNKNIIVETIKISEEKSGIIVRLYEAYGCTTKTSVTFGEKYAEITEVNLIERPLKAVIRNTDSVNLEFAPFEIKTLLIK